MQHPGSCEKCGSEWEPGFDICWLCGASVDGGEPLPGYAKASAENRVGEEAEAQAFRERANAYNNGWAQQARGAREAGRPIFQADIPVARTRGFELSTGFKGMKDVLNPIQVIEAEGWRLESAGYVHQLTGIETAEHLLLPTQSGTYEGEKVGIYLFRPDGKMT